MRFAALWALVSCTAGLVRAGEAPRTAPAPPDIQGTELVIRPDLASGRLDLKATLEIANPSGRTDFSFLLASWYERVEVRSRAGAASVARDGNAVTVHVARPSPHERLVFTLSGSPGRSGDDDRPVLAANSIYLLWSDYFYPEDLDDWSLFSTEIELPKGFRVFAPGLPTLSVDRRATKVERYETSQPIRTASIVAETRWIETERTIGGRKMRTLLDPASEQFADQIFRTSTDVLDFYSSRFGPYAFDQFTFATVEGIFARRAVAGGVLYEPRYLAEEMRTTGHDAHETALLWWFWTSAGRGPGSFQWTEGFGDYAEMLYDQQRGFPVPPDFESYRRGYLRTAGTPEELSITDPHGPLAGNFVHGRLPWMMNLLRFAVGDEDFEHGVRLLFDRWRFRSFTLDEFVATLAEGTGESLDWWRREWLERRGVPELSWHADIDPVAGGFKVTVAIKQTGEVYHVPLEIGIRSAHGLAIERVRLQQADGEFEFQSAEKPTGILIDPHRWLLARVSPR
jgi:hypothetical protein